MVPPEVVPADSTSGVAGADIIALPVLPGNEADASGAGPGLTLGSGSAPIIEALDTDLRALLAHHRATGKAGEIVEHVVLPGACPTLPDVRSVLLVGVGSGTPADFRRAGAALARKGKGGVRAVTTIAEEADEEALAAFAEGLVLGSFGFDRKSVPPTLLPLQQVLLTGVPAARQSALDRALARGRAAWQARTLALVPSNEKNPEWLAERAREVATEAGLRVQIWHERQLAAEGFGGIVGVGQGSDSPPRLVRLDYSPAKASRRTPHVVLVGKGITFDTGGYSIKPADGMATMKRDMTGAGVVMSVLGALRDVGCRVKVTALLACAENSVSGHALRPGDVVRHYGGRTSEVTNTDAEGRLVMADALAYAVREIKPRAMVDVATLTGAMKVALGQRTGGFFANDEALAQALRTASDASGEALWRMPLVADYEERLDSTIADADNAAGGPGAITAALFLQHFTGNVPWAHLDIASVGDSPVDAYEWTPGATGFGARVLLHWLGTPEPLAGVRR
ncbi:MAG: leucyl aminopeptidase family protein [Nocardioidaceae bacterium]